MEYYNDEKYNRAKKKVKKEKEFYSHITVYLIVNVFLILMHLGLFQDGFFNINYPKWSMFTTPLFWGIGLFCHWLSVFHNKIFIYKKWEERKMKEFMEKDEEDIKRNTYK